jgi:hypothetical protein
MKGIIYNLLEEAVSTEFGDVTWDRLLDEAQLSGAYTSLGNYPDGELVALVDAASKALDMLPQDVLRWFGLRALPMMAVRYPEFFNGHTSTRSFLLTLNDLIHPEVHKLYPAAMTPVFDFGASDSGALIIGYDSPRKLCALAEGFILGAADYFGERADIKQPRCMHLGDSKCELYVDFHR